VTEEVFLEAHRHSMFQEGRSVLLVGEDNPRSAETRFSLYPLPVGCAGHRLRSKIMQLPMQTYLSLWRTNLCVGSWSKKAAEARARVLGRAGTPWVSVVLLGRKVSDAFGHKARAYFDSWEGGDKRFVLLPHPSGRNLLWNHADNYGRALEALRQLAPEIPWGVRS
jgi:hypothetical protein